MQSEHGVAQNAKGIMMPESATSTAPVNGSAEPSLDSLLVNETAGSETADSGQPAEAAVEVDAAPQADTEVAAETEDIFDESTVLLDGVTTDYSDAVYEKYAKHFAKQWGKEIDINDPFSRKMLHELISRGQKIAEGQVQPAAETEEVEAAEDAVPESKQPQPPTPEEIQRFRDGVSKFAESMIRDDVTLPQVKSLVGKLFGDKVAESLDPKQSREVAREFISMNLMILNDVLPQILGKSVPELASKYLGESYPLLADMHTSQLEQRAFNDLAKEKDKAGRPLFADLQKMKDSGALDKVFEAYPWLKDGDFKDAKGKSLSSLENRKYVLRAAYNMARGIAVSPAVMSQIAAKGKEQAVRAQAVTAASKLAAGESKGGFTPPANDLLADLRKYQDGTSSAKIAAATGRSEEFSKWVSSKGRR